MLRRHLTIASHKQQIDTFSIMDITIGNGIGGSNSGQGCLHFTSH